MKIDGYSVLTVEDSEHDPKHDDDGGKGIAAACRNTLEIDSWHLSPSATQRGRNRIVTKIEIILSYQRITVSTHPVSSQGQCSDIWAGGHMSEYIMFKILFYVSSGIT